MGKECNICTCAHVKPVNMGRCGSWFFCVHLIHIWKRKFQTRSSGQWISTGFALVPQLQIYSKVWQYRHDVTEDNRVLNYEVETQNKGGQRKRNSWNAHGIRKPRRRKSKTWKANNKTLSGKEQSSLQHVKYILYWKISTRHVRPPHSPRNLENGRIVALVRK